LRNLRHWETRIVVVLEVQENNSNHSIDKFGDTGMRKKAYAIAVLGAAFVFAMVAGCGKNVTKYTFRDAGIEALEQGNYKNAIESFDKAIDSTSGLVGKFDTDVLKYRAEAEYLSEDYKAASDTYDVLMEINGEKPEYLNMRSVSRVGAGDYEGAVKDFRKSQEMDPEKKAPGYWKALLAAGEALEQSGEEDEAMNLYQTAVDAGRKSAELYNRMGLLSMKKKDWEGAELYFTRGDSAPDSAQVPELLFNRAVAMEYKGDFNKALELMQQYLSVCGTDEDAKREITFLKTR
jgi:tetratricopeptide (TPR) repeat protein